MSHHIWPLHWVLGPALVPASQENSYPLYQSTAARVPDVQGLMPLTEGPSQTSSQGQS